MKKVRTQTKQALSVLLAVVLLACAVPVMNIGLKVSAISYDRNSAICYAAAHALDAPSITGADCANFVSKCVTAGGISVSETVCINLRKALEPYGMVYDLETIGSGAFRRVPIGGNNNGKLEKGDVMFTCCERCRQTGNNYERHAVIFSGDADSNGYARAYAHTSANNNDTYYVGYKSSSGCSNGHSFSYIRAEVVHFSSSVSNNQNGQGSSVPAGLANLINKKFLSGTVRQNVSNSAVSCNASNGNLPNTASTLYTGSSYYFNVQVSNNLYVKTAKLYIKDAGKSSYSCVSSETAGNYMRYTYSRYRVGSSAGTLYFYWKLTFTDGSTKTLSKKSVPVKVSNMPSSGWPTSFRMKSGAYTNAYDGVNGSYVGRVYPGDVVTVKYIYTNGWMKLSCPWDGGYNKIVYCKVSGFQFKATKYINAYDGVNGNYVGRVYPNDLVTVKTLYNSGWMKCVCPWDGGYNKTIFVKVGDIY